MAHNDSKHGQQDRTERSEEWDKAQSNSEQNVPSRSGRGESGMNEDDR